MADVRKFVTGFIVIYLLISLPAMLGIGYEIDWVSEATFPQKLKGYVIEGLANNYLIKITISIIGSIIFSLFLSRYKANQSK